MVDLLCLAGRTSLVHAGTFGILCFHPIHRRRLPVMAPLGHRLPIAAVPEQRLIASMWADVVDDGCKLPAAADAPGMSGKERLTRLEPRRGVTALGWRAAFGVVIPAVLLAGAMAGGCVFGWGVGH